MKAFRKTLFILFLPILSFSQINDAVVIKSQPEHINKANGFSDEANIVNCGKNKYGFRRHGTDFIYWDYSSDGNIINVQKVKDYFQGRYKKMPMATFDGYMYKINNEVVLIFGEKSKTAYILKCQKFNLITKIFTEEKTLSTIPEDEYFNNEVGITTENKIYAFIYSRSNKENQTKIQYNLYDSSLSPLASVKKSIPMEMYYGNHPFFKALSIDNNNQMYLVIEQRKDGEKSLEVRRISPDGTHKRIKVDMQSMNIPSLFIKQLKDGDTYMAGFQSYPKKKIANEIVLWK